MGQFAIGQGVPRFEDPRLVSGRGMYIDDVSLPNMAHGFVLRSAYAHAKILSIDTSAAKEAPGVLAILTGEDWTASGWGDMPVAGGIKKRDGSPAFKHPYPALVTDRVRWVGDYVAFVVAETINQAKDAAELIDVQYKPLPVVTSTAAAMDVTSPRVWDECPDNVCFVEPMGDKAATDAAFAKAAHVVKTRFVVNRVTAATMEPRGCVGIYDQGEDHYTLHTAMQRAFSYRSELAAKVLKLPESKVRIIGGDIGGSFGMKTPVFNEGPLCLLASKLTGRPVKWISSRSDGFLSDAQARDNVTEAELALDKHGHFLGVRVKLIAAAGAYCQPGMPNFTANVNSIAGVYRTPAIFADVIAVYTHTNPVRPYRGNGRPEAAYVIERLVDLAADELGIDPAELRRRNYIPPTAMPYKTAMAFTYDSGEFERSMDMAIELADMRGFNARRDEAKKKGRLRGIGLAYSIERAAQAGFEAGEIRFDRSGTATMYSGSVHHGQGHETTFKQIVCDRLGLDPHETRYIQADTDKVSMGEGTGGSRTAALGGSAFLIATDKIIVKARQVAAQAMKVDFEDVDFNEGILSSQKSNKTLTIKEVAKLAIDPADLPDGMQPGLIETGVFSVPVANYPNGCHICEVEIDPETGVIEMSRYAVVDDVGTVLNPLLLHGQIHGGVVQGIGQILMEDIRFDDEGQLITGSFMDYAMPRAEDICPIKTAANPVPTPTNPLGVKGAGEAGTVGALPAVANAIIDALSPLGIRHIDMPATPERVWRAIREATPARL